MKFIICLFCLMLSTDAFCGGETPPGQPPSRPPGCDQLPLLPQSPPDGPVHFTDFILCTILIAGVAGPIVLIEKRSRKKDAEFKASLPPRVHYRIYSDNWSGEKTYS